MIESEVKFKEKEFGILSSKYLKKRSKRMREHTLNTEKVF